MFYWQAVLALLAWFLNSWRLLQLGAAVLTGLTAAAWLAVLESPRWLLASGRTQVKYWSALLCLALPEV